MMDRLYRFFSIDDQGHVHSPPEAHVFASDMAALRKAQQLNVRYAIEVWEGRRLIGLVSRKKVSRSAERRAAVRVILLTRADVPL